MATRTRGHGRANNGATGGVMAADAQNWPNLIFAKLREFDVRHVTYVPDSGHARMIELCHAADDRHHAWRVGRSQSLAGADGPDRSRRPAARGRDCLRSDRAESGGPGRGGSRAHCLQWQPDRRGPALAAHAQRQAFQGLNRWTNKARYGAAAPSPEYWPIAAIRSW